jgi:hypothetical protein
MGRRQREHWWGACAGRLREVEHAAVVQPQVAVAGRDCHLVRLHPIDCHTFELHGPPLVGDLRVRADTTVTITERPFSAQCWCVCTASLACKQYQATTSKRTFALL